MKGRTIGIILLLVGSIAIGILAGQINWVLFKKTVPPAMVSELNMVTVPFAIGLFTSAALFVWGLLVALVAPVFRGRAKPRPPA